MPPVFYKRDYLNKNLPEASAENEFVNPNLALIDDINTSGGSGDHKDTWK